MGVADIIPGVSGGTLALILGIYAELVNTIRGLNLGWLAPLWRYLRHGRRDEDRAALIEAVKALNLGFMMVLGAGIATAIVLGSMVIPSLMERYPEAMRGLFFGLILASVMVPFRMISFRDGATRVLVAWMIIAGAGAGFVISNPGHSFESGRTWVELESRGESLETIARRGPSAAASEAIYWAPENEALREALVAANPEQAAALAAAHAIATGEGADKDAIKARSAPYDKLEVPGGVPVKVPQPTLWFIFLAGAIAICAMILPGISGSYILLILGAYFFILNALKGFLKTLASGEIPISQGAFVIVFCAGAGIGLLSFARLLSYLLRRFPAGTLGVLVGLMVGCLRGIWPFRQTVDGAAVNVLPAALDASVMTVAATFVVGALLVVALSWLGRVKKAEQIEHGPA